MSHTQPIDTESLLATIEAMRRQEETGYRMLEAIQRRKVACSGAAPELPVGTHHAGLFRRF